MNSCTVANIFPFTCCWRLELPRSKVSMLVWLLWGVDIVPLRILMYLGPPKKSIKLSIFLRVVACTGWVRCQMTLLKIIIEVTHFKTKPAVNYLLFRVSFIVVSMNGGIRWGQISFELANGGTLFHVFGGGIPQCGSWWDDINLVNVGFMGCNSSFKRYASVVWISSWNEWRKKVTLVVRHTPFTSLWNRINLCPLRLPFKCKIQIPHVAFGDLFHAQLPKLS